MIIHHEGLLKDRTLLQLEKQVSMATTNSELVWSELKHWHLQV